MYGRDINTLSVFVKTGSTLPSPAWSLKGNQGKEWYSAEINITTTTVFNIVFEGIVGTDYQGDIALDDISILPVNCALLGPTTAPTTPPGTYLSCTFETDLCGFREDEDDDFDWTRFHGETSIEDTGPSVDHTTDTEEGYYMYLDTSAPQQFDDKARLESPVFPGNNQLPICVDFWYNMNGRTMGVLNVYIKNDTTLGHPVWSKIYNQGLDWKEASINIAPSSSDFTVVFEGIVGDTIYSEMAIDDISIYTHNCSHPVSTTTTITYSTGSSELQTEASTNPTGPDPRGTANCTFETSFCNWEQDTTDDFDWSLISGPTLSEGTGPDGDHTQPDGSGQYIYIETNPPRRDGDTARLIGPDTSAGTYCLIFYYNMYGEDINTLNMYVKTGLTLPSPTWSLKGPQGKDWHLAEVDITTTRVFNIVFEGISGISLQGDLALDDISIFSGTCAALNSTKPPQLSSSVAVTSTIQAPVSTIPSLTFDCTFESNTCGWKNLNYDDYDWSWGEPAADVGNTSLIPDIDHTTLSGSGHYVYYDMKIGIEGGVAYFQSPLVSAVGPMCLSYWYNMNSNVKELDVYVSLDSLTTPQQRIIGSQGSDWKQGLLGIDAESFMVTFGGIKNNNGIEGVIALDDILLTNGNCEVQAPSFINLTSSQQFLCNFERDLCAFTQETSDDYDWTYQEQGTDTADTGPDNDHTYQSQYGHYMYAEASSVNDTIRRQGDIARLNSPTFLPVSSDVCLNFYYHMYGADMGNLNIRLRTGPALTLQPILWTMYGNLGNQWNLGEVTLPALMLNQNFSIVFEAIRGESIYSDIALDDVTVKLGSCISPATCNFDKNVCSFYNYQPADLDWMRHSGATDSDYTGPSNDHTEQNSNGYYMYLEASSAKMGQNAIFSSERLIPTNSSCFTFWYHMYGSTIGTLKILISQSSTQNVTVWSLSGDQENLWSNGQVPIISPHRSFSILIEAVRGSSYEGDIAIDDVEYHYNTPCGTFPHLAEQS